MLVMPKGLRRCGVAGEDDEVAIPFKQVIQCLPGEFMNDVLRAVAVGHALGVTEVEVIVLGQPTYDGKGDGQPAKA